LLAESALDIRWLATAGAECDAAVASSVGARIAHLSVECLDVACGWCELGAIEDTIPDAGVTSALRAMLRERP
jgi:hypothetical protein